MPYIEFNGEVRPLGPGVLTVGSAPEAGWRILGRGLEPVHLMLSVQTGARALLIRGTPGAVVVVNGIELVTSRTLLSFGDRVQVGTAELRFRRLAPGHDAPGGYLRDTRRGRLYQLRERSTIGRDLASTVTIHEPDVSRLHAELIQRGEAYLIVPHGASVTSINGARLIAPTVLQEADEIAVGRTVLRFTTALPVGASVPGELAGRAGHLARESRAQTTFIGAIEAREQRSRATRRRISRMAAVALGAIAVAAVVVTLYSDARALRTNSAHASAHAHHRVARAANAEASPTERASAERRARITRRAPAPQ